MIPRTADDHSYSVDSSGCIRPLDGSGFAVSTWDEAPTFSEALLEAGTLSISNSMMGVRNDPWVGALIGKYLLDIEDGASLVTAINCRRGRVPFTWRGDKFYPVRPDFGFLLITSAFGERALNKAEQDLRQKMFEYRDAIFSLHQAIKYGQLDPASAVPFQWWVEFWGQRGIAIHMDGYSPAAASPASHPSTNVDPPGPKPGRQTRKDQASKIAIEILEDNVRRPAPGHGRIAALARSILAALKQEGISYQQNTCEGYIRDTVKHWQWKNPNK